MGDVRRAYLGGWQKAISSACRVRCTGLGLEAGGSGCTVVTRTNHRDFDKLKERRRVARRRDDLDVHDDPIVTWHPNLPPTPDDFPKNVTFGLRHNEAVFIRDRILEQHPDSLLAWFAREGIPKVEVEQIWEHPQRGTFMAAHEELIHHGSIFSEAMYGAALIYNLQLAELRDNEEWTAEYAEAVDEWTRGLQEYGWLGKIRDWNERAHVI